MKSILHNRNPGERVQWHLIMHNLPEAKWDSFFPTTCPKCWYDIIEEYDNTIFSSSEIMEKYTDRWHEREQYHAHKCPKCSKCFTTCDWN
jgi:hypothetical protein